MTSRTTDAVLLVAAFALTACGGALLLVLPMVGFGLLVVGGAVMGVLAAT